MNKWIGIGRVGTDPEVKTLDSNKMVAKFSFATIERYTQNNERKEETTWHNIVVWGKLAEIAEKWVKKGNQLAIEGKVKTRSWDDKDGHKKYITEIVADSFEMIGPKPEAKPEVKQEPMLPNDPENTTDPDPNNDLPF
jgi:single-strand DNA-binding protein